MNNDKVTMQFRFVIHRYHVKNTNNDVSVCREFLEAALPKQQRNRLDDTIYDGVELTASKYYFRGAIRILFVNPCRSLPIFDCATTPWLQSAAFKKERPNWYRNNTLCPLASTNRLIKDTFFPGEESLMGCVLFVSAKLIY